MTAHDETARRHGRPRLTDSPWFWLLVFANAALVGVVVIGPKYNQRQAAVERRYEARREIARRAQQAANEAAAGESAPVENAPGENVSGETVPGEATPLGNSAHLVPLRPLALTLALGNLLAIILFAWNHIRQIRSAANSQPPSP